MYLTEFFLQTARKTDTCGTFEFYFWWDLFEYGLLEDIAQPVFNIAFQVHKDSMISYMDVSRYVYSFEIRKLPSTINEKVNFLCHVNGSFDCILEKKEREFNVNLIFLWEKFCTPLFLMTNQFIYWYFRCVNLDWYFLRQKSINMTSVKVQCPLCDVEDGYIFKLLNLRLLVPSMCDKGESFNDTTFD